MSVDIVKNKIICAQPIEFIFLRIKIILYDKCFRNEISKGIRILQIILGIITIGISNFVHPTC